MITEEEYKNETGLHATFPNGNPTKLYFKWLEQKYINSREECEEHLKFADFAQEGCLFWKKEAEKHKKWATDLAEELNETTLGEWNVTDNLAAQYLKENEGQK